MKAQCFLNQLLLKGTQSHNIAIEICQTKHIYGDDINFGSLPIEFQVLQLIVKDRNHQAHMTLSRYLRIVVKRTDC